jgi:hypothetical protein
MATTTKPDPATMTNMQWWNYATERWIMWQDILASEPPTAVSSTAFMVNSWQRQRMIAYVRMTDTERNALRA